MSRTVCPVCRQHHRARTPHLPNDDLFYVAVTLLVLLVLVAVVLGLVFG